MAYCIQVDTFGQAIFLDCKKTAPPAKPLFSAGIHRRIRLCHSAAPFDLGGAVAITRRCLLAGAAASVAVAALPALATESPLYVRLIFYSCEASPRPSH